MRRDLFTDFGSLFVLFLVPIEPDEGHIRPRSNGCKVTAGKVLFPRELLQTNYDFIARKTKANGRSLPLLASNLACICLGVFRVLVTSDIAPAQSDETCKRRAAALHVDISNFADGCGVNGGNISGCQALQDVQDVQTRRSRRMELGSGPRSRRCREESRFRCEIQRLHAPRHSRRTPIFHQE